LGEDTVSARFISEIEVWLAASACDGVAPAFAVVRINESPAIVGRWLDGGDLAGAIPQLPSHTRFEVILRTCRTLDWVHRELGVIHRDLKPGNVLLDTGCLSHVSDWGLARPAQATIAACAASSAPKHVSRGDRTQRGTFVGTALYAAPEQFLNASSIDHRADIYALGCIMHELETGTPPFVGADLYSIARMHLTTPPPRLGGLFRRTTLGLDKVIYRCLAKDPERRYQSHAELEADLVQVAASKQFPTARCVIGTRGQLRKIGTGLQHLKKLVDQAAVRGRDVIVLEAEQVDPLMKEASDLMALGRHSDAEPLLRAAYLPDLCRDIAQWMPCHSIAAQYALCLCQMNGRNEDSLGIFRSLSKVHNAPPEFSVNYSLALLRSQRWLDAKLICEQELIRSPNDPELLGNYSIALRQTGDLDLAMAVADRRLTIRRDVSSLSEAAGILENLRLLHRNSDLPRAASAAETEGRLIAEGLGLNPRHLALRLSQIRLARFAHARVVALCLCDEIMKDETAPAIERQLALAECLDIMETGGDRDVALRMLNRMDPLQVHPEIAQRLRSIRIRLMVNVMIGTTDPQGARMVSREVADCALNSNPDLTGDTVTHARALDWMGRAEESERVLRNFIAKMTPGHTRWEARRQLVRLLEGHRRISEAIEVASILAEEGPWRAASFDELHRVAGKAGNKRLSEQAKQRADQVYADEMMVFEQLRRRLGHES
jgi:tetratricopeptide (TPR) repeat protein